MMTAPSPLLIGFEGTELNRAVSDHLQSIHPVGVILFQRNIISIPQTKQLIQQIRDLLGDIIIAIDHEGGIVSRFPAECPVPPSPGALARLGSLELVQKSCQIQAELLSYLGINLNLAPVLDLGIPGGNSVLGPRVYSSDPHQVGVYGEICVKAHHSVRVGTSAKHFPGHGNTTKDTHFDRGTVDKDDVFLWENDLIPFRHAITAQVPAIMSAHLIFPALDAELPATLSNKILTELLRNRLGFEGLIITDCVEMAGLSDFYSSEEVIGLGIKAGVDLWISSYSIKRSASYQKKLKKVWRELSCKDPERVMLSEKRLRHFLARYPLGASTTQTLPDRKEVIEIHKKTIRKATFKAPKFHPVGGYLVELKAGKRTGINAGEKLNSLSMEIKTHSKYVKAEKIIYSDDVSVLRQICEKADRQRLALIFITANGYLNKRYPILLDTLKNSGCSLHIALLEENDLNGSATYEWSTRGFCKLTGEVIAKEIGKDLFEI